MSKAAPVIIDSDKCIKCLDCVKHCPTATLYEKDDTILVREDADMRCIRCAHCLGACPVDAITIARYTDKSEIIPTPELSIDPEILLNFIRSRRSTRLFKSDPIEKTFLESLINAARYAPSAHNDQTSEFILITGDKVKELRKLIYDELSSFVNAIPEDHDTAIEILGKLVPKETVAFFVSAVPYLREIIEERQSGLRDRVFWDAPALILIHANKKSPGYITALENATLAAAYLMLMAEAMELGTCSMGILVVSLRTSRKAKKLIGLPRNHRVLYGLAVGNKATNFKNLVPRNKPKITYTE